MPTCVTSCSSHEQQQMKSNKCCVTNPVQVPSTPEYTLEDRSLGVVEGNKQHDNKNKNFFTRFLPLGKRNKEKTYPTPPTTNLVIKNSPLRVLTLKKSPNCDDLKQIGQNFVESKICIVNEPVIQEEDKRETVTTTRLDLDRMRRQFFQVLDTTETVKVEKSPIVMKKSNIPVPSNSFVAMTTAPSPKISRATTDCGLSKIPIRTTTPFRIIPPIKKPPPPLLNPLLATTQPLLPPPPKPPTLRRPTTKTTTTVMKPTPSTPFYTTFLYRAPPPPPPPLGVQGSPVQLKQLVNLNVLRQRQQQSLSPSPDFLRHHDHQGLLKVSMEKVDTEKGFHSSADEIYLIDDEISDQPDLTFNGDGGGSFDHLHNNHQNSKFSSLSSVASLESNFETQKPDLIIPDDNEKIKMNDVMITTNSSPPHPPPPVLQNLDHSNSNTIESSHLHAEISSLKCSLELLKKLLIEQEKRERDKDALIQRLLRGRH